MHIKKKKKTVFTGVWFPVFSLTGCVSGVSHSYTVTSLLHRNHCANVGAECEKMIQRAFSQKFKSALIYTAPS